MARATVIVTMVSLLVAASWAAPALAADAAGTRDGLYLRLGAGPGFTYDAGPDEVRAPLVVDYDHSLRAFALAGEIGMGTYVLPGLALGGAAYPTYLPAPRGKESVSYQDGSTIKTDYRYKNGWMLLIGPFADYYVKPVDGLHLQAALGYTFFGLGKAELDQTAGPDMNFAQWTEPDSAGGFGAAMGVGYDVWVNDTLSVGALGRLQLTFARGDEGATKHRLISPALLVTATWSTVPARPARSGAAPAAGTR